uniref:Uncharacterized protein n=1 Tax=Anguilla anguilla TaxID=7936 RepID=A0A0E9RT47_ANGAN
MCVLCVCVCVCVCVHINMCKHLVQLSSFELHYELTICHIKLNDVVNIR